MNKHSVPPYSEWAQIIPVHNGQAIAPPRRSDLAAMERAMNRGDYDPFGWGGVGPSPLSNYPSQDDTLSPYQRLKLGAGEDIGEVLSRNATTQNERAGLLAGWAAKGYRPGSLTPTGYLWHDGKTHGLPVPKRGASYVYRAAIVRRDNHPYEGRTFYSDGRDWKQTPAKMERARTLVSCSCCTPDPNETGLVNCSISTQPIDELPLVATLEVYRDDVRIRRKRVRTTAPIAQSSAGKRSAITEFSKKSANRLLHNARNVEGLDYMATFTYPREFPTDGAIVKAHWKLLRDWLTRTMGVQGLMVLEFQKRGAPHLHCYLSADIDKQVLSQRWFDIVGSGDLRHLRAGTKIELLRERHSIYMYCVKYVSKSEQKEVPEGYENVGRFWSLWGGAAVKPLETYSAPHELLAPIVRLVRRYDVARRRTAGLKKRTWDRGGQGFTIWGAGKLLLQKVARTVNAVIPDTGEMVKTQCQTTLQAIIAGSARLSSYLSRPPMFAHSEPCIA